MRGIMSVSAGLDDLEGGALLGIFGRAGLGLVGNHLHVRRRLIAVELLRLSGNRCRLVVAIHLDDRCGVVGALIIRTVAAAETCIGLGRLVGFYRVRGSVVRGEHLIQA